jgi:hypothetical protein
MTLRILLCRGTSLHAACALTVLIGFTTHGAALADGTKGCDQVSLQAGFMMEDATKRVFSDAKFQAITIRAQTPTYMKSSGVERMAKALVFDQRFRVVDPGERAIHPDAEVVDVPIRLVVLADMRPVHIAHVIIEVEVDEHPAIGQRQITRHSIPPHFLISLKSRGDHSVLAMQPGG